VSGSAIDVPRWSVGDVGVVGNAKQEVGKIVSCVLAIKEKVPVVVRCRRPRVPGSDQVEFAEIEAKLHGVLPFGPGQVLIDLEVVGKLRIGPGVNDVGDVAIPGFEDKVGETAGRERSQLLWIQPQCLHEGRSIDREGPAILSAADSSAQLIHQVWSNGIVVREHDLIVMFEILFRRKAQARRAHLPLVLVGPAPEDILLGINGVVDANIKLIGKDGIGNVECVVEGRKIVHAPLDWQRIILENRGGSRIELARWDNVARIGRSVQVLQLEVGTIWIRFVANLVYVILIAKLGKIAVPHILVGYRLQDGLLCPVPHAFVVAKEEGVILKDGSAEGSSECVCAFSGLARSSNNESRSVQGRVLKILKDRSMKCVCARLAGRRNVRRTAIFCSAARPLYLHF